MINIKPVFQLFLAALVTASIFSTNSFAAAKAKPIVAIKKAEVGEGVSKYSKKYLVV